MFIYVIRNKITNKCYVGQTTKTLEQRWKAHLDDVRRGSENYFHNSIRKHGSENFEFVAWMEVGESQSHIPDVLDKLEIGLIAQAQTNIRTIGYNSTMGGDHGSRTEEVKLKMSAAAKARFARLSPQERSAHAKKAMHTMGPSGLSARAKKANDKYHFESRSVAMKKAKANMGPERRSAAARKRVETMGPERRSEQMKKANATRGPEGCSAAARKRAKTMGPERLTSACRKRNHTVRHVRKGILKSDCEFCFEGPVQVS